MKKPKPTKQPKQYDIHRTLAHKPALSPAASPVRPEATSTEVKDKKYRQTKRIIAGFLLAILVLFIGLFAWDARNFSNAAQTMFGSGNLLSMLGSSGLKTDDNGRVNVLIAGYSADDPGHPGAKLTDSILLLSMSSQNHTGYMLSIPRDLYTRIPGFDYGKINEAYGDGGMDLLSKVVENDFAVKIGYTVLVNYASVRDSVNALGGINVTVNSHAGRLYDPSRDYSTGGPLVDLTNGTHHLNGQQALNLTRARGDPSGYGYPVGFEQSDFQRTADQRLVFTAIKNQLNWKLLLDPRKNSQILNAFAANLKTNIKISEVRPLFGLFNSIPSASLQSLSLRDLNGKNYLASSNYQGDTLTPVEGLNDYSRIQAAIEQLNQ